MSRTYSFSNWWCFIWPKIFLHSKKIVFIHSFVFTTVFLVYHDIIQRNNINLKTIKQIIYDWKNRKFRSFVNELTDTVCFLVLQNSKKNSYTKTVSGNDNFHGYYQWYNVDHKLNWNESIDVCRNELIWWP